MKNPFYKFTCKVCNEYQTYSIIKFMRHLKKEHNKTLTKRDLRFAIRHHIITQILAKIFLYPIALIVILLQLALYPFHWLYEFFDSF
jgi:hypothetical protein